MNQQTLFLSKFYFQHTHLDYAYGAKRQFVEALKKQADAQSWTVTDLCLMRTQDEKVSPNQPLLSLFLSTNDKVTSKHVRTFAELYAKNNGMIIYIVADASKITLQSHSQEPSESQEPMLAEFLAMEQNRLLHGTPKIRVIETTKSMRRSFTSSVTLPISQEITKKMVSFMSPDSNSVGFRTTAFNATNKVFQYFFNPTSFPVALGNTSVSLTIPTTFEHCSKIRNQAQLHEDVILLGFYAEPKDGGPGHFVSDWFGQTLMTPMKERIYNLVTLENLSHYMQRPGFKESIDSLTGGVKRATTQETSIVPTTTLSKILAMNGKFEEAIQEAAKERQHEITVREREREHELTVREREHELTVKELEVNTLKELVVMLNQDKDQKALANEAISKLLSKL